MKKSIYRPGDAKKTVRLSSQVSPDDVLQKLIRKICILEEEEADILAKSRSCTWSFSSS